MYLLKAVLFLLLQPTMINSANIFVSSPFGGSHLSSVYDIAVVLADAGHNITFISLEEGALETYFHPKIYGYTVENQWPRNGFKDELNTNCLEEMIQLENHLDLRNFLRIEGCADVWKKASKISAAAYSSDEIMSMFNETKFDIIVAETSDMKNLGIIAKHFDIPVVCYVPNMFIINSVMKANTPLLLTSQPGIIFGSDLLSPPSFWERTSGILYGIQALAFHAFADNAAATLYKQFNITSAAEVEETWKLFLTNDHVAFSFPFLRPGIDLTVGGVGLLDRREQQLPEKLLDFIKGKQPVVYVSFGSYVDLDEAEWFKIVISSLEKMDVKVVVKVGKTSNLLQAMNKNVLPMSWAPQKDLLASGQVKLFISHCGNNGRIEAIFFNVPVLCVPLFADQGVNAEVVKMKNFGEILPKVNIVSEEIVTKAVNSMFGNYEVYHANMKRASDIVRSEPGNVKQKLIFYINYLAKYGNVDILENSILRQQSIVEIYNLDILSIFMFLITFVVVFLIYFTIKCVQKIMSIANENNKLKAY